MNEEDLPNFDAGDAASVSNRDGWLYLIEDLFLISGSIGIILADCGSFTIVDTYFAKGFLRLTGLYLRLFTLPFHLGGDFVSSIRFFRVENFRCTVGVSYPSSSSNWSIAIGVIL